MKFLDPLLCFFLESIRRGGKIRAQYAKGLNTQEVEAAAVENTFLSGNASCEETCEPSGTGKGRIERGSG